MMAETPERKEGGRARAGMEAFVSREISRELKFEAGRCAKSDRSWREGGLDMTGNVKSIFRPSNETADDDDDSAAHTG